MFNKKKSALRIAALLLIIAALCGQAGAAAAADIVDGLGRTVRIEGEPQRIVVLPVWAEEMLLDMAPERVVGVSAWGDNPALSATAELAKEIENRVSSDNAEGILALEPDLVVLDTYSAGFDGALADILEQSGITVLCMASPTSFSMVLDALETLGEAAGAQENAAELIAGVRNTLNEIAMKVIHIDDNDRVSVMFYEDYYDESGSAGMLCAYGPGSPFDAIAKAAGVRNICDAPNYSPVSKEKVVAEWRPQILIVPSCTFEQGGRVVENGGEALIEGIRGDATLADVPAVQNGWIYSIPDVYRGSTSHYMVQAAKELAQLAYPITF